MEGDERVGGLAGIFFGSGPSHIRFCYTTGQVTGRERVGGLLGVTDQSTFTSCYSAASVTASGNYAGGFVGWNAGIITSCYSTGSVIGSGSSTGGFVGFNEETITSCYSTGSVTGGSSPGGFAGTNAAFGTVSNSFWDKGTSGIMTGDIGTGKTTSEMKGLTTFGENDSDWDFGDVTQYPALKKDGSVVGGQPCPRAGCYFGGGAGTDEDPYQISSIEGLNAIRGGFLDDHFVLMNDLDFTGHRYSADDEENAKGWLPIGHDTDEDMDYFQGTEFTGSFDGGGYVIRNLSISRGGEDYIGLFGAIGFTWYRWNWFPQESRPGRRGGGGG